MASTREQKVSIFPEESITVVRELIEKFHGSRKVHFKNELYTMTKSYALFSLGTLIGAIAFYSVNPLISLFCFFLFICAMYGAGKLG